MNISLYSFSLRRANSLMHITSTRFNKFMISDFFISHSASPFFTSFNNKLESFSLTHSLFNRYLSPVTIVRCSSTDDKKQTYRVERTIIMNSISNNQGSALCCKYQTLQVHVSECTFINCTSKLSSSSYQRTASSTSGGACFFSVGELVMKSVAFESCVGASLGSAVYASTVLNNHANVSCLCDVDCGNSITTIHSIYAFEVCTTTAKNINSTSSISKNIYGTIHLGNYPATFSVKYLSIIARESESITIPLGLSLQGSSSSGFLYYAYIKGCKNSGGLISLWRGSYILNNVIFNECAGNIYSNRESFQSITFTNSFLSPSISMVYAKTDDTCQMINTESVVLTKCFYYQKMSICSAKITRWYNQNSMLLLILLI